MNIGILCALLASMLITAKDVVSKKVSSLVDPLVSSFASFLYAVPFYLLFLLLAWFLGYENFLWTGNFWLFVFLRALTDTVAESSRMLAFKEGELSSVAAIFSLHPIMTLIFSPLLTGDPLSPNIIWGVLLATTGTYCFLKVPAKISVRTLTFSLIATVFFSLNSCFDRLSAQNASALLGAFSMNMMAGFLTLPFMLIQPGASIACKQLKQESVAFSLRGFFEAVFMTLKLLAVSVLQAPVASAIFRLNLIFQVIAGRAFFSEEGLLLRTIGSILIILGSLISLI